MNERRKEPERPPHPEQRPGEKFLGNTTRSKDGAPPKHLASLTTVRCGEKAYTLDGVEIVGIDPMYHNVHRPLFIQEWEEPAYDRIMTDPKFNLVAIYGHPWEKKPL